MVKRGEVKRQKLPAVVKKILRVFIILITLALVSLVVSFVFVWQYDANFENKNIVFVPSKKDDQIDKIIIASFDEKSQKVYLYTLPSELKTTLIGGYGEYPLGSILPLLKIDKKDTFFVSAAFSHAFGLAIDGVEEISINQKIDKNFLIKSLFSNKKTWPMALQLVKTPQLDWRMSELNTWEDWEKALDNQFKGRLDEHCSIAIVNATNSNGLASSFSQILENSGLDVVRTTDSIWDKPVTSLYKGDSIDETCGQAIDLIQKASPVLVPIYQDEAKVSQYRARLVLFIGDEIANILNK